MPANLVAFAFFQGCFLAVIMLIRPGGIKRANRIIAVLLLLVSVEIGFYLLRMNGKIHSSFSAFMAMQSIVFLYGPLVYMYIEAHQRPAVRWRFPIRHFVPAMMILGVPILSIGAGVLPGSDYLQQDEAHTVRIAVYGLFLLQFIQLLIYGILAHRALDRILIDGHSPPGLPSHARLKWLGHVLRAYIIFTWMVVLFFVALITGVYYSYSAQSELFFASVLTLFIHVFALVSFLQPAIFNQLPDLVPKQKYQNGGLSTEQKQLYKRQLILYMAERRPYRNFELTLGELAEGLSIRPHHLSQIINDQFEQNFFDFVNSYRVGEAKVHLSAEAKNQTILSIGYEVGFNSKTAFNRAFKKHARMTPTEFRKRSATAPPAAVTRNFS